MADGGEGFVGRCEVVEPRRRGKRHWPDDVKARIELRPVFRTVCLLTLRGHFPSHIFESLFWRFVADA
jgi:transposase